MTLWLIFFLLGFSQMYKPLGMQIAERYGFIYNIALSVLTAKWIEGLPIGNLKYILLTIFVTLLFSRTWDYIKSFRHINTFFQYSIINFPETPESYNNAAMYQIERGQWHKALELLLMAHKLSPYKKSFNNLCNIARCYRQVKAYDQELRFLEMAISSCPKSANEFLDLQIRKAKDNWALVQRLQRKSDQ
jgi:tetratricopeptide (TPR) repeat protein